MHVFYVKKIDFRETELNLDDEISIDIILDLLKKIKMIIYLFNYWLF